MRCDGCGEKLSDVEWLFDPCPVYADGTHREPETEISEALAEAILPMDPDSERMNEETSRHV